MAPPLLGNVEVVPRERVPPWAVRFSPVVQVAPEGVLSIAYRFQVFDIGATAVSAKMIDLLFGKKRANVMLKEKPMKENETPIVGDMNVA